jgi:hypothetical protein
LRNSERVQNVSGSGSKPSEEKKFSPALTMSSSVMPLASISSVRS